MLRREMDQGVGWQPQAKVPLLLMEVVQQMLMHEAAIGKQGNPGWLTNLRLLKKR